MHVSVCVCVCPTSLLPYTTSQWSDVFAKCFGFKHYRLTVAIEQVHRCKSYEVKEKSQGGKKTESLLDSNWSQPNLLKQKTASERSSAQRSHILCTFQQAKKYNSIWFFVHFLFWRFLSHGYSISQIGGSNLLRSFDFHSALFQNLSASVHEHGLINTLS